jgi:hypothetical protein
MATTFTAASTSFPPPIVTARFQMTAGGSSAGAAQEPPNANAMHTIRASRQPDVPSFDSMHPCVI